MEKAVGAIGLIWLICAAVVAWSQADRGHVRTQDLVVAPFTLMRG